MTPKNTTSNGMDEYDGSLVQAPDPRCIAFNEATQEILNDKEHDQLFIGISLDIKQFQLQARCDAAYVLNEAYNRGVEALKRGKDIGGGNYRGWLRLTSYYIIRELDRDVKKNDPLTDLKLEALKAAPVSNLLSETAGTAEQELMKKAFAQLSELEQTVVYAKIVDGWKYKEIQAALIKSGHKHRTEDNLSQIKSRALKKIRAYFAEVHSTR